MKKKRSRIAFRTALGVVLIVAIYMLMTTTTSIVNGPSMLDTYQTGDRVLVSKAYWLVGKIKKDDIVVIHRPNGEYLIKRTKFLAGDQVPVQFYPKTVRIDTPNYRVPEGMVFVMGDNRAVSEDSRAFGPVPSDQVVGKVISR